MKKTQIILLASFLALPIIGVLGVVVEKEITLQTAQTVRLPISGYDPRHLMYGHYLRFRFEGANAPDALPHEYYIPEDSAAALESILRNPNGRVIEIDVRFVNGKQLKNYGMLYIDGKPWRDYLSPLKIKMLF